MSSSIGSQIPASPNPIPPLLTLENDMYFVTKAKDHPKQLDLDDGMVVIVAHILIEFKDYQITFLNLKSKTRRRLRISGGI